MERYILANALANIDFDLLASDDVRNLRGYWGETMEIRFPRGVVFIYIDENCCGFIKMHTLPEGAKTDYSEIYKENLNVVIKCMIEKAKTMFV